LSAYYDPTHISKGGVHRRSGGGGAAHKSASLAHGTAQRPVLRSQRREAHSPSVAQVAPVGLPVSGAHRAPVH
jgi:hypothetical protein